MIKNKFFKDLSLFLSKSNSFFWTSLLLSLTVLIFIPMDIYTNASSEFNAGYISIIVSFGLLVILFTITFTLVGIGLSLIHIKVGYVYNFLILILSMGCWMQAYIITGDYGVLDGRTIDWNTYSNYFKIEAVVWGLLIALIIIIRKKVVIYFKNICIVLIVYQIVTCVSAAMMTKNEVRLFAGGSDLDFSFSKNQNVLILVLDTFSGELFKKIIDGEPEYAKCFDGFTFFSDALGGYPTTVMSIPLIMTGEYYENQGTFTSFLKNNDEKSIDNVLESNGYKVIENDSDKYSLELSNFEKASLINITGIRILPHIAKKYSYNRYLEDVSFSDDLEIVNRFVEYANNHSSKDVFSFIKLWGNHPPYLRDENLELNYGMGDKGIYRSGKGVLKMTATLIETLKSTNVYDNTLIFIIGDHGDDLVNNRRNPLFLVKGFNDHGEIQENDAPISLSDISKSITEYLNINYDYPGYSIFDPDAIPDDRIRIFYDYEWRDGFTLDNTKMPPLQKLLNIGKWDDSANWINTFEIYDRDNVLKETFDIGSYIDINSPNTDKFLLGFSGAEAEGRWTVDSDQRIIIPLSEVPTRDLDLQFNMRSFIRNDVYSDVYVNDYKVGTITQMSNNHIFTVKKEFLKYNNILVITLSTPITYRESDAKNARAIALFMKNIKVDYETRYDFGSVLKFNDINMDRFISGFYDAEIEGRWTKGNNQRIRIPLTEIPSGDIELQFNLIYFIESDVYSDVYVNGFKVGTITQESYTQTFTVKKQFINESTLTIDLDTPIAHTNINGDARNIAFFINDLTIQMKD